VTPEEAALRVVQKLGFDAAEIHLRGSRVTPYGTVVVFTTGQDRVSENSAMGFVLTQQQGSGWVTRDVQRIDLAGWVRNSRYADVSSWVMDLNGPVGATYGEVLKLGVAAVEVTFDNGQVLRDTVTPEGMFVLLVDGPVIYCTVRVLDTQDQVLETIKHPECS
jgi:hypothetical protein